MTAAIIIQHYITFYVLLYFCVQWVYQSLEIILHLHISKLDSQTSFRMKPVYLRTYSMAQSPFWEANWFAASQEIPRIFMEPEGSLPHSQASATCPCPGPAQSSPHTHIPPSGDPS